MAKGHRSTGQDQNRRGLLILLLVMLLGCAVILGACVRASGAGEPEQTMPTEALAETPAQTSEPTQPPTEITEPPTELLTEPPTEATEVPTTAPPTEPTTLPTTAPTEAPPDDPSIPREVLLTLVNFAHTVPENWTVDLVALNYGEYIDSRAYPSLQRMMADCRAAGCSPIITSGYRTHTYQAELFEARVRRNMNSGMRREEAEAAAAFWVARPGTSEHELGFAIDIGGMTAAAANKARDWMRENSWRYGWILRYPSDKGDITGIGYEDWHYRFVGVEAARDMHETGLCLEEYLGIIDQQPAPTPENPEPENPEPEDPIPEDSEPEDPVPEDSEPGDLQPEEPQPENPQPENPEQDSLSIKSFW